jgi:WXXGXW repeat (2 copies)
MRLVRTLGLLLLAAIAGVSEASAQIVSITVAPPVLPVYEQPPIPGPGYIWTPGYWAWGDDDYYWVPGTWVLPPAVGLLWTPGYWGWRDGIYAWNAGYWGPHIGFYGGVNYGFGYTGVGYAGGFWRGGVFSYNRTVNNFGSVNITNTYNKTVINNTNVTNVSFNGGAGGTTARATPGELAAANDRHTPMTSMQTQHQTMASQNKEQYASRNNGLPKIGGTSNAANLSQGAVPARTATTGPAGGNPAAGGAAKGGTGGVNTLSTKQATGTLGPGPGSKGTNNAQSPGGAGPGGAGPGGKLTSTGPGGSGPGGAGPARFTGGGPPGGGAPARFTGGAPGGPTGPRTANFGGPRPQNFGAPGGFRPGGGPGPRPGGGGGGPHPANGPHPQQHH